MDTQIITLKQLRKETAKPQTIEDLKNAKHRTAYVHQAANARVRKIVWNMTYDEWLTVWMESGKLELRGKTSGCYCMSRFGDKGAYEIGNVFINRVEDNLREGNKGIKKSTRHAAKLRKQLNKVRFKRAVTIDGKFYNSATEAGLDHGMTRQNVMKRCKSTKWANWKADGIIKRSTADQVRMSIDDLNTFAKCAVTEERQRIKTMIEQRQINDLYMNARKEAKSSVFAKGEQK